MEGNEDFGLRSPLSEKAQEEDVVQSGEEITMTHQFSSVSLEGPIPMLLPVLLTLVKV